MPLADCISCGGPMRLRARRITVNRRRGVSHWVEHMTMTRCTSTKGDQFATTSMKSDPLPKRYESLVERWNAANANGATALAPMEYLEATEIIMAGLRATGRQPAMMLIDFKRVLAALEA